MENIFLYLKLHLSILGELKNEVLWVTKLFLLPLLKLEQLKILSPLRVCETQLILRLFIDHVLSLTQSSSCKAAYKPKIVDGNAVRVDDVPHKFTFILEETQCLKISRNISYSCSGFSLSAIDLSAQTREGRADEPSAGGSERKAGKIVHIKGLVYCKFNTKKL